MSNKRCPKCGKETENRHTFCSACGAKLATLGKQSGGSISDGRRWEYPLLLALIVATVIVYNLAAGIFTDDSAVKAVPETSGNDFGQLVALANGLMDRGLYEQAIGHYQAALEIDSLHPEVLVDVGACYHALGDDEQAIRQFNDALVQDSSQVVAMFNMGVVYFGRDDRENARIWWQRLLDTAPDHPQAEIVRQQMEKL